MKLLIATTLLFFGIALSAQYNYGLEVEAHDAKIEGKLNLVDGVSSVIIGENAGINDDGTDNQNTFIGSNAGAQITSGRLNLYWL